MVPTYDMRRSMNRKKNPLSLADAVKEHIRKRKKKVFDTNFHVEALKIIDQKDTNAGLNNERNLAKLLHREWDLKARRLARSGAGSEDKPADIRLALDDSDFLIEAKLRTDCYSVYDTVHETDECHKVVFKYVEFTCKQCQKIIRIQKDKYIGSKDYCKACKKKYPNEYKAAAKEVFETKVVREAEYFFVSQENFRQLLIERIAPKIIENPKKDLKFYDDLFRETINKEKTIDILALRQRTNGMKHVFIVRPKTMQKLMNRCERHET